MNENSLPPVRIANKIRQLRQDKSYRYKSFLIVEGITDKKLFSGFIVKEKCEIIDARGRENAERILEILNRDSFIGVIAIVDSDFRHLENITPHHDNLFFTDTHDMETMILKSPAFEKLLTHFISEDKVLENNAEKIRNALIENCLPIGCLLWISIREDLNLRFEELAYKDFINEDSMRIDVREFIRKIKNHSQKLHLDENEYLNKVNEIKNKKHDHNPWFICCGHDMIKVLSLGLKKCWGTKPSTSKKSKKEKEKKGRRPEATPEILAIVLSASYDYDFFKVTDLYCSIRQWENRNGAWSILRG